MTSESAPLVAPTSPEIPPYPSAELDDDPPPMHVGTTLPAYPGRTMMPERRIAPTRTKDFCYKIDRNGKKWASMVITADETVSKFIPTFLEGESIKGKVELLSGKGGDDIRGIIASVTGEVVMGTSGSKNDRIVFLDISETLWTREMGDPRQSRSQEHSSLTTHSQKLTGNFTWEFELNLPKEVSVPNGQGMGTYRLPQTLSERYVRGCVVYQVSVRFLRGKLIPDNMITTPIGFIPVIHPPPFSPLRQLVYQEGLSNLLGPTVDPEGWHAEEPVRIKGKLFNNRQIDISCQLHFAKPLLYTRGTAIPMCLTLQGSDFQALDLLSNPKVPVVQLQRRIRYEFKDNKDQSNKKWEDDMAHSLPAVWWSPPDSTENPQEDRRVVNGELHLKNDLNPTSSLAQFRLEYSVVLNPFIVTGFESTSNQPLLEQSVDIVTAYASGPRPKMLTPPGYNNDQTLHTTEEAKVLTLKKWGFL